MDIPDLDATIRDALAAVAARPASKSEYVERERKRFVAAMANVTAAHEPGVRALRALALHRFTVVGKQSDDVPYDVQEEQLALDALQGPIIRVARQALESAPVAQNLLSYAGEPEIVRLWTSHSRELPGRLASSLFVAHPSAEHVDVDGRRLTFFAGAGGLFIHGQGVVPEPVLPKLVQVRLPYVGSARVRGLRVEVSEPVRNALS
jgi:hypothetical protein